MRLPKNPKQYKSSWAEGRVLSNEELQKVVWGLLHKQYRTLELKKLTNASNRLIRLPDGSEFNVYCGWKLTNTGNTERFLKHCIVARLTEKVE